MAERPAHTLHGPPSLGLVYARGALAAVPGLSTVLRRSAAVPSRALRLRGVTINGEHLTAYQRLCGFTADDRLPHTYPHVLGFALQASIMARRDFPVPMVGLVHLENTITVHRPLTVADVLTITVHAQLLAAHPKGRTVELVTEVDTAGGRVWEGRSVYLSRGSDDSGAPRRGEPPAMPEGFPAAQWSLPAGLGREYAAVSGDVNPIHLNALTAKAMGFPRQIAHGMWSYARVLAALGRRADGAVTSHVWFRRPILLPSTVDLVVDTKARPLVAGLRSTRTPEVGHLVLTIT